MKVVYRHIRLDKNEPFYVGMGNKARAFTNKGRSEFWNNIVSKTDYRVDIIFEGLTVEEAIEKEIEFIKLYGRRDKGLGSLVNLKDGGEGFQGQIPWNKSLSLKEETKQKIKSTLTGYRHGEKAKSNMSKTSKNTIWYNDGFIDKRFYEGQEPKGFNKGRIFNNTSFKKKTRGWYTNGILNKHCFINEQPEGFHRGRTLKIKK